MNRKRVLSLLLAMCLSFGVAAGCTSAPNPTPTPAASTAPSGDPAPAPSDAVPAKDTVIVTQSDEPTAFVTGDRSFQTIPNKDGIVIYNIYDSLMFMKYDGSVEYMLATEYSVSDDGLEYTFKLRDDVYFHNGYKMTAEDVAFTYNMGLEKYPSLAVSLFLNLDHVEAVDETTVKMVLTAPYAGFINCTTCRLGLIMSKQYYEEVGGSEGYNNAPIGTGAYKFGTRISGESVTMVANEEYWGGAPAIKNVIVKPIANASTQFLSLENGEVDMIARADIASCLQITGDDLTWGYVPSTTRNILVFFAVEPKLAADKNLRKAIQCAIDKEEILLGSVEGYGTILDQDIIYTYRDAPDPSVLTTVTQDLDKAREYLEASSYNGEPIVAVVSSGSAEELSAQIIQGQLLPLGINIEVRSVDAQTRNTISNTGEGADFMITNHASSLNDVAMLGWNYAPSNAASPRFDTELMAETEVLVRASDVEMDPVKRQEFVAQILNISTEEALVIPLYNPVMAAAWNVGLKGVQPHLVGTCYLIKDWSW